MSFCVQCNSWQMEHSGRFWIFRNPLKSTKDKKSKTYWTVLYIQILTLFEDKKCVDFFCVWVWITENRSCWGIAAAFAFNLIHYSTELNDSLRLVKRTLATQSLLIQPFYHFPFFSFNIAPCTTAAAVPLWVCLVGFRTRCQIQWGHWHKWSNPLFLSFS